MNRFQIIWSWRILLCLLRTSVQLVLFSNIPWELSMRPLDFRNDEENVHERPLPLTFQTPTVLPPVLLSAPVQTLCSSTQDPSVVSLPSFIAQDALCLLPWDPVDLLWLPLPASSQTLSMTYIQPTPLSLRPNMALSSHRKTLKGLARAFVTTYCLTFSPQPILNGFHSQCPTENAFLKCSMASIQ